MYVENGALVLDGVAISNSSADVRTSRSRAAVGTRGGGAGQTGGACRKQAAQCPWWMGPSRFEEEARSPRRAPRRWAALTSTHFDTRASTQAHVRAHGRTHSSRRGRTHARTAHPSYSVHPRYAQAGNGAVASMSGGTLLLDDTVISNTAATSVRPWRWRAVRWCVHGLLRKHLRPAALPCTAVGGGRRLQPWCRLFCRSRRCSVVGVPSNSRTRASASRCAVHE